MIGIQGSYSVTEIITPSVLSAEEKEKLVNHHEDDNPVLIKYYF